MTRRTFPLPRWSPAVAVLAMFAAACADGPTAPTALAPDAALLASTASDDGKPDFTPNTTKYQDTSKPNATGRAGSATLTARALLAKDGTTLVEATTGEMDTSTTPPGNIDKMQVKGIVVEDEDPIFTENFNKLEAGGYFAETFEGLARGATAQVQANISGIDRNRTGVITLKETVKLRPDLEAKINAPDQAYVDAEVYIQAVVSEINGDVGARSDCVLYVDGAEADRAPGIWVDAAGVVTCSFMNTFAATGTYELTVTAENVVPGDWDTANNAATGSIEIIEATTPLHGWAYAADYQYDNAWAWGYEGSFPTFESATRTIGRYQHYYAYGSLPGGVTYPVDVELAESSGGTVVNSGSATGVDQSDYWYWYCSYTYLGNGQFVYLCPDYYYGGYGWYQYGRHAGFVTYYSSNQAEWTGSSLAVYSWNYSNTYQYGGQFASWEDDLSPVLTMTDADGDVFKADPQVTLNPFSNSYSYADCYYWYSDYCYANDYTNSGKSGYTSF
jgi:hypothetical protein